MPALKIAVNTRLLLKDKLEGIGYYAYETLKRIVKDHPDVEFHFLFDRPYSQDFIFGPNVTPVVLFPPSRHPLLWYWWFEWSVAPYLSKHKFDLFLSPDGYCSLRSSTPTLAIQHDIAFEHFPDFVSGSASIYYRHFTPKFMQHARRIATVSEYSKKDIARQYNISPAKIDVVYNAAKDIFKPLSESNRVSVRQRQSNSKPYLIYVGSIHPRKNLKNMLLAFDQFKKVRPDSDLQFLVAGAFGWQNSDLLTLYNNMQHKQDVQFLGRQSESELAELIGAAYAMLYVSIFEGFGVPPIEAMACGVSVITSDNSSLPEVCGDAALLVSPTDVAAIANAITQLWDDKALCTLLINKGLVQAQKFSWDQSAALLWDSCMKTIQAEKSIGG
jgi:glycosyltransferase involved in cell wall biosynthesis